MKIKRKEREKEESRDERKKVGKREGTKVDEGCKVKDPNRRTYQVNS